MQPVQLLPRTVALDPRIARVDHVADARHGQRGLGHVGRQHQPALRSGIEHPVLVPRGQPCVQRQHFGLTVLAPLQCLVGVADLALAGQEHQHVATRVLAGDFIHRRDDGVVDGALALLLALAFQRPVADLHRISPPLHADHRRIVEMAGEAFGVDGGRGDDDLQVPALAQQLLEVAQQEVDVEAALVGFVDDDGVVGRQPAVARDLGQQDAVGHELDAGVVADLVGEAHLVSDRVADTGLEFLRHPSRHRARGDPARLGAANHAGDTAPGRQAQLGQLGGLARAGLAGDDHHRMAANQLDDTLAFTGDRQGFVQTHRRHRGRPRLAPRHRTGQSLGESVARGGVARAGLPARPQSVQSPAIPAERAVDGAAGGLEIVVGRRFDSVHQSNRVKRFITQTGLG